MEAAGVRVGAGERTGAQEGVPDEVLGGEHEVDRRGISEEAREEAGGGEDVQDDSGHAAGTEGRRYEPLQGGHQQDRTTRNARQV